MPFQRSIITNIKIHYAELNQNFPYYMKGWKFIDFIYSYDARMSETGKKFVFEYFFLDDFFDVKLFFT